MRADRISGAWRDGYKAGLFRRRAHAPYESEPSDAYYKGICTGSMENHCSQKERTNRLST